ncbi:Polynucleotide 5'-hydroxyl-kinase grc3 [Malassezia vespertilionis]|nr:Polynucleotide 5'-hydroxyl-kinase grc3 [Malassezia vespertilionis]WFD06798.1 Polynucleotide 5'-hydroxyl-kinase grc3 [Malassezia vespertilionis]
MRIYAPEVYPAAAIYAAPASEKGGAFPEHDAVLCITASSPGIERIASVCPLAGPDPFLQSTAAPRTFTILADADAFIVPQEWRACIDEIQCASTPKVLVRGPKNAGKSSLAKLLLNALLSTHRFVAFLDLDMGQPEFGPPGFVALHVFDAHQEPGVFGPAWCLARVPLRAHFLGDISPREEPAQYSASVAALLRYFSTELHIYKDESQVLRCLHVEPSSTKTQRTPTTMPLIVNTHGWSKGLGADLVDAAARALGPSHVFALAEQAGLCAWHDTVYAREIQDTRRRTVNAAEVRQLDLLAYLHATQLPRPAMCIAPCWDFTPLLERRPYVVDLRTGLAGGISILPLGAPVVERFALLALNGSLAALVARTPARSTHSDPWRAALSQGTTLPSHAFGLVLLRSIDEQRGALHMLTPLSPDMLAAYLDAECTSLGLVKGALELPIWASLDQQAYADAVQQRPTEPGQLLAGVPRYQVPYLAWPTELLAQGAIGARPRKVRRNVMRRAHAK